MKKILISLCLIILCIVLACSNPRAGSGNQMKCADFIQNGSWIYFCSTVDDNNLYKMKSDGSSQKRLVNSNCKDLILKDGWIYYYEDEEVIGGICRVKTDGRDQKKLCRCSVDDEMIMNGDWIYFYDAGDLYRIRSDGSGKSKICTECGGLQFAGDDIYYINAEVCSDIFGVKQPKSDYGCIFRISDGKQYVKVTNLKVGSFLINDSTIFYTDEKNEILYRMSLSGTHNKKLADIKNGSYRIDRQDIYFLDKTNQLNRMKLDGTDSKKLTDIKISLYEVNRQKIYFLDKTNQLHRMNSDGTNEKRLSEDAVSLFWVGKDKIIYIVNVNKKDYFYSMTTDGKGKIKLSVDSRVELLGVWGNFLFCSLPDELYGLPIDGGKKITVARKQYPIDTNSVSANVLGNTYGNYLNGAHVATNGKYLFFSSFSDDMNLYRSDFDGGNSKKIQYGHCDELSVVGNWVFFKYQGAAGYGLYRVDINGAGRSLVADCDDEYNIVGSWIYYISNDGLYKMKLDGSDKIKLSDENIYCFNATRDWIYYTTGGKLYKMKTDGSCESEICSIGGSLIILQGDWIYSYDDVLHGTIYRAKTDGTQNTKIISGAFNRVDVRGDWIYYIDGSDDDNGIYRIKTDGTSKELLYKGEADDISLVNEWIYYHIKNKNPLYRMDINGEHKEKIR